MFSYPNKVVGIKITGQAGSDLFDIIINSGYVGSITGSGQGDGAYLIGTLNNSLSLTGVEYTTPIGYPASILVDINGSGSSSNNTADNPTLSGVYILGDPGVITPRLLINSGAGSPWQIEDGYSQVQVVGTSSDPSNPYGVYDDSGINYIITISPDPSIQNTQTPVYYFNELSLEEGFNEVCLVNTQNNGSGNALNLEMNLYEISGSYLVNPYNIGTAASNPPTGSGECIIFNLVYSGTGSSINLFEFDPVFNVDTGNLNQIFTGSGVHLKKDVTFFFNMLDQQQRPVFSNQEFLENPLLGECVFDVLNIDGTVAAQNFFSGKYSRSVTVTSLDNENIFGTYQKDFGVRCSLSNSFDGSTFTGAFFAYGNVPNILDIVPSYTEFSGSPQATESFDISIILQNDLRFTQIDRYDIYALTENISAVNEQTYLSPSDTDGYLLSQSATNASNTYSLTITKNNLTENIPYYFTVVPYGALGSGAPFVFGPTTFVSKQSNLTFASTSTSELNIYDGAGFSSTVYRTGVFANDTGILHQFSSGQFTSVKYFVEIRSGDLRQLSELKGVVNSTGLHLTHEPANDTSTTYQLTGLAGGLCGLYASGDSYTNATYKLQATMI